ncbi:AraC family transcriptional regulator [Necropsobacter rosorum]|uniref:AraC family transcriptional regulator n=1 Tax=Necropsobacter rosorum TaxID=908285 RepID=UPI000509439A
MDYLDRLLQLTKIEGEINILCRFQGDWIVSHPQADALGIFHLISQGSCRVQTADQCYHLHAGDLFFLPYGTPHTLSSTETQPGAAAPIVKQQQGALTFCRNNQLSHDFEMFCGYFRYASDSPLAFLHLPQLHLSANNRSIMSLLTLLQQETTPGLANKSVIDDLCTVLFTYLMRDYLQSHAVNHGILAALQDKRLFHAANAMLQNPAYRWTMDNLAERCALSRASFIRLFKQKTGALPGKLLSDLRMQKAQMLVRHTNKSIFAIAAEVGYQSESHFSQIFKRYFGSAPSQYRTSHAAQQA